VYLAMINPSIPAPAHHLRCLRPHFHTLHGYGGILTGPGAKSGVKESEQNSNDNSGPVKLQVFAGLEFYFYGHEVHEAGTLECGHAHSIMDLPDHSTVHLCATDASGGNISLHCVCRPVGQCECLQDAGPRALARWTLIPGWNADENVPWRRRKLQVVEESSLETIPQDVKQLAKNLLKASLTDNLATKSALFGTLFRVLKDVAEPELTKTGKRLYAEASIYESSEYWQNERPRRRRAPTIFYGQYASSPLSPPRQASKRRPDLTQDPDIQISCVPTDYVQIQPSISESEAPDTAIQDSVASLRSQDQKNSKSHSEKEDPLIGRRICKLFSTGRYEGLPL
jgi:hypothetical protein